MLISPKSSHWWGIIILKVREVIHRCVLWRDVLTVDLLSPSRETCLFKSGCSQNSTYSPSATGIERQLGKRHPDTLDMAEDLARTYFLQARYDENSNRMPSPSEVKLIQATIYGVHCDVQRLPPEILSEIFLTCLAVDSSCEERGFPPRNCLGRSADIGEVFRCRPLYSGRH
jgi:hypothetical protein